MPSAAVHPLASAPACALRRRELLTGSFALAMAMAGCGGGDGPIDTAGNPLYRTATVTNAGTIPLRMGLSINGAGLFASDAEILAAVAALEFVGVPPAHPGRRFALALWRFLTRNRYNDDPLTAATWAHAPTLLINSLGFGYCDDVAAAFAALARAAGYPARVWSLVGHVVPEIWVGDRWEMFDPDLGVYYLDDQGLPCSVDALAADATLITAPRVANPPAWATEVVNLHGVAPSGADRYSRYVADIYASAANNQLTPWYDQIPYAPPPGPPLLLPPGASAAVGLLSTPYVITYFDKPLVRQGALRLTVRAGFVGRLDMPLIPVRIAGTGIVRIDDFDYTVAGDELRRRLAAFEEPNSALEVVRTDGPLIVEYLLSDKRFELETLRSIETPQVAPGAVTVSYDEQPLA